MDIDPKSLEFKEICALYGAAMHMAQVLEHGIVNALFFLDFIPNRKATWTDEEFEKFYDGHFSKTFGVLVQSLRKVTEVSDTFDDLIRESNKQRNFLAHAFFRENMDVLYAGGFDQVAGRLHESIDLFQRTDGALTAILEPLWIKFGWTTESIEAQAELYKAALSGGVQSNTAGGDNKG